MNQGEKERAVHLGVAFKDAGFQVSQVCCSRPSCFDFAAKKDEKTALIKVCSDVDCFSRRDSRELRIIAGSVSAAALVIGKKTHEKRLEDDTVYSRYAVHVVSEKTAKNIAFQTGEPLVNAGPGGYFVEVDGHLVEKRRKELELSIGKLSEMIGVSRRTLYGYERNMAKASVSSAYNLAKVLGIPVARPVNVLARTRKQRQCLLLRAKHTVVGQTLLQKIFRKFAFCDISPVVKAPFDFVITLPEENCLIVGGVAEKGERHLSMRAEEILSICRVIRAHPVLVTERRGFQSKDLSCVCEDELSVMRSPEDLLTNG